ncbi:hypothetical protein FHX14_002910 [Rhizobium sp. BK619]|nr:hypothetical protein [Rhizobium sp. BK619]
MIVGDRERHDLLELHFVLGIEIEKPGRDGRKPQALPHRGDRDEEPRGDLFLIESLFPQRLEGAELIKRMQADALDVFGERIFDLKCIAMADDARNAGGFGEPLLRHKPLKRTIATPAGRDAIDTVFFALRIEFGTDIETGQKTTVSNVFRELLDRHARLDLADVLLAEH